MPEDKPEETIVNLAIDAGLLAMWTATAPAKSDVKKILSRSQGGLMFFPSEAADLSASASRVLPGPNENTGINVAGKFSDRISAHIPA